MLRFAIASLGRRKGSALGAFLALFFAAAMVSACGVVLETGIHGAIRPQRYAGAPVVVSADQHLRWAEVKHKHGKTKVKRKSKALTERAWVSTSVGARLRTLPHARVVPDLIFSTALVSPRGAIVPGVDGKPTWGHAWASAALTPYSLVAGTPPRHHDDVVLDSGLAGRAGLTVGEPAVLQSASGARTYRVVGIARPRPSVTEESAAFFAGAEARRLAGHPGSVAAFGVFGTTAEQARAAVSGTDAVVSTGDARGPVEFVDAAAARVQLVSMGGAIGATALIVALLVVAGTFALSLQQRRRELALLRTIGATPRQIRRIVGREALLVGGAAAIPGALLGIPLARLIHTEFVSVGAVPDTLQLVFSPLPVLAAIAVTVVAAWVAARLTTRRTTRIRPTEALTEADVEPQRLSAARVVPGLAVTVAAVGVTVLLRSLHTAPAAMPVSYVAVLLWMVAVALLGPLLTRVALTLVSGPLRRFPVAGFLAVENARANARRVASVVTPLTLLLGMAVTILFVSDTIDHAARTQVRQGVTAGHVVTAQGPGVPGPAARALRGTPGVRAVTEMLPTTVWLGHHKHAAEGVTTTGVSETIDPGVTSGSLARFRVGTVALSDTAVGDRHIGDTVQLTLGDGSPIRARLVAVYSRNLGFGDVLLPDETVARHVDDPLAAAVLVNGITSSDEISSHLTGYAGLTVGSKADYEALEASRQHVNTEVNVIFMALILGFTAIAVINTLAISIADRSRELSLMRLAGATASQVVRTLVCELGLAIGIAVALGTAAAWLTLTGFSDGMVGSGTPAFVPTTYAVLCAVALALGLVGTLLPARLVLVRHPYDDVTRS